MPREITNLVVVALFASLAFHGPALAFSGSGSGTEVDPYIITDVYQLQEMRDDLTACYVLGNDIDASGTQTWNGGAGFEPVGSSTDPFTGKFDGRMFTITGLYINRPTTDLVGLFGHIRNGAVVQSVGLAEVDVTARRNSGPLVGSSSGATVCYCWSTGNIRGSHDYQMRLGGLIGISSSADSYVYQCFSSVNVTATGGAHQVGGLAGYNGHGSIMSDCYATGDVSGHWKVGGLVGDNIGGSEGTLIIRCYSSGRVTGSGGGLVGFNWQGGVTRDSYWDVQTSAKTSSCGGTGKTTTQMMQEATFVNWDFVNVWDLLEDESYPSLGEVDSTMVVVNNIEHLIREKVEQWEGIDVLLRKEHRAYRALDEMLRSGNYGDLGYSGIVTARDEIYSAILQDEQSKQAIEYSIKRLESALRALGFELVPEASD